MNRAVFDANVFASGFAAIRTSSSTPGELVRQWRVRRFALVLSDQVLEETRRTPRKPYFQQHLTAAQAASAVQLLRVKAERVLITVVIEGVATHPEDDLVLATAVAAKARYLVTGDKKLQRLRRYRGVTILSPREFLTLLDRID
ncbi:MAG: putative toxin-antitoxin system toxin component, PIN family [Thermomicrobiales bacterium]